MSGWLLVVQSQVSLGRLVCAPSPWRTFPLESSTVVEPLFPGGGAFLCLDDVEVDVGACVAHLLYSGTGVTTF